MSSHPFSVKNYIHAHFFLLEKLVVFDLDETLVHCIFNDRDIEDADIFLDILMINGKSANTGFNIRPYWKELMDEIKKYYEIVVFTASCQNYADTILDYMDPENEYFERRLYRETCWRTEEGVYIKDLRVFQNWDLKDIILVDNAVYSFGFQLDNGIPIFPYIQGKDDEQLLFLKDYLVYMSQKETISDLKKVFQMNYLLNLDIDDLQDIYIPEEEEEEECTEVLLDQLIKNQDFINRASRSPSFGNGKFQYQNKLSTSDDHGQETTEEESKKSSPGIVPDCFIRSNSNNDEMLDPYGFNDPVDLDSMLLNNLDNHLLEQPKGKKKKKGGRLTMMRKNPSVIYKKEKRLDSTGDLTQSLVDNNSSNNDSHKNAGTPKVTAKKKVKRRKLKNMKGCKGATSAVTEADKLEEEP